MPTFTPEQARHIAEWLRNLQENIENLVDIPIRKELLSRATPPREITSMYDACRELEQLTKTAQHEGDPTVTIDDKWNPLLKLALLSSRRTLATELDIARQRTVHSSLIESLDAQLAPFDQLMEQAWFDSTVALRKPQLADFLTLGRAEAILRQRADLPERVYDEKFHILQAPSLILQDLAFYRDSYEVRGGSVAIAYLDIDHLKRFNTQYGETTVDRNLLPRFMASMEAFVFGRGHAYRHGGDEYVVLLPSLDRYSAEDTLEDLRRRLAELKYDGIDGSTTVSVGFCALGAECFLTGSEAAGRAE